MGSGAENPMMDGSAYLGVSKLETLLGRGFWGEIAGKVVIDFGCGAGSEALEMADRGSRKVIGLDLQLSLLAKAREHADRSGLRDRCEFTDRTTEKADVITAIDSFEHFADPLAILNQMHGLLKPDGCVWASFGPTWLHPLGGHLFSVVPWAHLIFTERSLIRWRSDFKTDGATKFEEVAGGLNRMTIRRFEKLIDKSPFKFVELKLVPIRKAAFLHSRVTREFLTATVRCKLAPK